MIIEMTPHLRIESLDMGIKGCRRCYKHGKQRRIERIDIANMHYRSLMLEQMAYPIRYHYNAYHTRKMMRWTSENMEMNCEIGSSGTTY